MIGRLHHLVLDCPDPAVLARFYSELLGWPVTWQQPDFVVVAVERPHVGAGVPAGNRSPGPGWPDPARPQQLHVDVMVDDLDAAEPLVLALGARRLTAAERPPRVYADPAGHPFCLIPRPSWASPVHPPDAALGPGAES